MLEKAKTPRRSRNSVLNPFHYVLNIELFIYIKEA